MPDYTALAATAQRLVDNAGRSITLVKFNTTLSDASKPWLGADDPRVGATTIPNLKGVFVEPSSATKLGMSSEVSDLLKRSTKIVIVSTEDDLEDYNEIVDGAITWKITGMETLKPADTTLLYFIGLKR